MPVNTPPLIGRAAVLAELIRRARNGQSTVVVGPKGSGGTRLLADAFVTLRRSRVAAARIVAHAATEPGRLDAFLPLLDRVPGGDPTIADRSAVRAAVLALPLRVLVVDDAHLLDVAGGALLADLARSGVAVLADATGPGGPPDALRALEQHVRTVTLDPLTADEVIELAEYVLGGPIDGELATALTTGSGSRPGSMTELIEDAVRAGAIVATDGLWRQAGTLPVLRAIRTAVLDGFTTLPPDQRGWIAAVVTAGAIAPDLARRIASPATMQAALESGWTIRDPAAGCTRIASERLGAGVAAGLDSRARIAVLRRLIAATLAVQRPLRDEEQVGLLRWRIELGEQTNAQEALQLALLPTTDRDTREVLLRAAVDGGGGAAAHAALADHLRRTHRSAEALQLVDAVLPTTTSEIERVVLVRVRTMTMGFIERRTGAALAELDAHLSALGGHPDLLAVRAGLLLMEGRPKEAAELAATVLGLESTSHFAAMFALLQRALSLRELGLLDESVDAARLYAAIEGMDRFYPQGTALAPWLAPETALAVGLDVDDVASSVRALHAAVPLHRRARDRPPLAYTLAALHLQHGEPRSAVRLLREADAGSGGWRDGWQPRILAELSIAQALTGAIDEAATTHARLLRIPCPPVQQGRVSLAAAQLAAARGDREAAAALANAAAERGRRLGLALDAFDGTFAAIRYGDPTAAERLLALGTRPSGTGREAQRDYAAALLGGDPDAVDLAALGLWQVGLRHHGLEAAARAIELGATGGAVRLVAWLARTPDLRLPDLTAHRGEGLTAREREVAAMAAAGASDRAIADELGISLRTAQTHIGRALSKLGVHRRADLRELISEP